MASIFSYYTSANSRIDQIYTKGQSKQLHAPKFFMYTMSHALVPSQKSNCKLYMVPYKYFSGVYFSRTLPLSKWIENSVGHLHSGFPPPRFKMLDDSELNTLGNTNDLERQLEDLFNEIKSMIKLGKENDAVDLLQANYDAVMAEVNSGAQGVAEAALLDVIALGYMALGDLRTVESVMDVLHKIVKELKDEDPLIDSILMHMGSMHANLEKYDKSVYFYQKSLKITEIKFGSNSTLLCNPLLGMAKALSSKGSAAEAIKTYQRVIALLESSKGEEGMELVVPLCALGNLLIKEGKTMDAEIPFNRVLKIFMKSYGEKDGRVGMIMCSLAKVKCAKGEVNDAIDLYKSSIDIFKESKYMELDDEMMEKTRIELAELFHAVGRQAEGRALLEECLLITENSKGKEHPSLVPNLVNLATSYSRSKNFAEAERLLRISLQISTKNIPPGDPSITFPMLNLAITLYNLHRDEEAERLASDALRIREKAFGQESIPVGEAIDCLVSIQSRLEKGADKLIELLKRLLKIQEKAFGPESMEVVETLKKLVHYMDKIGLKNEKNPLQNRLYVLRNKHKQMIMY